MTTPPIAQVRDFYSRVAGAAGDSFVSTVRTLSPGALANAVRDRSAVAVPVGQALRRAAWYGMLGSAMATFADPFVVRQLDDNDWFQSIVLQILDRGTWWVIAAAACLAIGFVAMVFTNGARRATRLGLVALSVSAVLGTASGLPALLALVVAAIAAAVFIMFCVLAVWLAGAILCSMLEGA